MFVTVGMKFVYTLFKTSLGCKNLMQTKMILDRIFYYAGISQL